MILAQHGVSVVIRKVARQHASGQRKLVRGGNLGAARAGDFHRRLIPGAQRIVPKIVPGDQRAPLPVRNGFIRLDDRAKALPEGASPNLVPFLPEPADVTVSRIEATHP